MNVKSGFAKRYLGTRVKQLEELLNGNEMQGKGYIGKFLSDEFIPAAIADFLCEGKAGRCEAGYFIASINEGGDVCVEKSVKNKKFNYVQKLVLNSFPMDHRKAINLAQTNWVGGVGGKKGFTFCSYTFRQPHIKDEHFDLALRVEDEKTFVDSSWTTFPYMSHSLSGGKPRVAPNPAIVKTYWVQFPVIDSRAQKDVGIR